MSGKCVNCVATVAWLRGEASGVSGKCVNFFLLFFG